jgi:hypothetical protein
LNVPLCANRDQSALQQYRDLFNDLVGERQEGFRDRQPKRLGGFEIDDKIEFICLFYWNIAGLRSAQILSTKSAARRN